MFDFKKYICTVYLKYSTEYPIFILVSLQFSFFHLPYLTICCQPKNKKLIQKLTMAMELTFLKLERDLALVEEFCFSSEDFKFLI